MNTRMFGVLARGAAIIIAVLAIIDPSFGSQRASRPYVSLIMQDSASHSDLASRVQAELERKFKVVRSPFDAASATVLVGTEIPPATFSHPVFLVRPAPNVKIESVSAPSNARIHSRVNVQATVTLPPHQDGTRQIVVALRRGDVTVDRAELEWAVTGGSVAVPLDFIPADAGSESLRIVAHEKSAAVDDTVYADIALDVVDRQWSVLFVDQRPSWMSTYVRRALESDPRFSVTSRVVTSRNISTDAGDPPASLSDAESLQQHEVIVAGAPELLTASQVSGLESYLRNRGGSVVFLLDTQASGAFTSLTGVREWSSATGTLVQLSASHLPGPQLTVSEYLWPAELPAGGGRVLSHPAAGNASAVVWSAAVGSGRIVVNGALDSWRFRDSTHGAFDSFWRATIAEAAEIATEPIELSIERSVAEPSSDVKVHIAIRESVLQGAGAGEYRASVSALLVGQTDSLPVTLLPGDAPGNLVASIRSPAKPGEYHVRVKVNDATATTPLIVKSDARSPMHDDSDLLGWWTSTRGGKTIDANELQSLLPAMLQKIQTVLAPEVWHPMRLPWWIIPFALLLGSEWWIRRRRGLP